MKRFLIVLTVLMMSVSVAGISGAESGLKAMPKKPKLVKKNDPYKLWLEYQFTPGLETFGSITGAFSNPAETNLHGYQYALAVDLSKDPGLDWSDLSRVMMTPPEPINSQASISSCYTGTDLDPFTNRDTRYVDFFCEAGAFLPATPPSGTYMITVPLSAGTGTQSLFFTNVNSRSIDPDLYGIFVPSIKLTTDSAGNVTRIDWQWWKKAGTGAWSPALDAEISALFNMFLFELGPVNWTSSVDFSTNAITSASGSIVPPAQPFSPARFRFVSFDNAQYAYVFDWQETPRSISMVTPYVSASDIASIREAFSTDASAPWGFAHNGIDFFPTGDLKPFRAALPGIVEHVEFWQNEISLNWQVNVLIRYDSTYSAVYAFEPMSPNQADGQMQFDNISVVQGQVLSKGDLIGNLYITNSSAHVHFGFRKNDPAICPEPYFAPEARTSIMELIQRDYPAGNMCY